MKDGESVKLSPGEKSLWVVVKFLFTMLKSLFTDVKTAFGKTNGNLAAGGRKDFRFQIIVPQWPYQTSENLNSEF